MGKPVLHDIKGLKIKAAVMEPANGKRANMFTPGFRDTTDPKKSRKNATGKKSGKGVIADPKDEMQVVYNKAVSTQINKLREMGVYIHPERKISHNPNHVVTAIAQIEKNGVTSWSEFVASQSGFSMSEGSLLFRHSELDPNFLDEVQVTILAEEGMQCPCGVQH